MNLVTGSIAGTALPDTVAFDTPVGSKKVCLATVKNRNDLHASIKNYGIRIVCL